MAGAASSPSASSSMENLATVRTRSQLESLAISRKAGEEELDETILDADSESEMETNMEIKPEGARPPTLGTGSLSTAATDDPDDVFDEAMKDVSSSNATAGSAELHFSIGGGHATVKAARKAASSRRQLNPAPTTTESASFATSFTNGGDERILTCNISHNLRDRTSTSHSFNTVKKDCNTCVSGGHGALVGRGGKQIVMVAADQSFPACVPSTDSRECIRVVRVEDGSLQEVIHALADAIGQSKLGTGTIIALGSISHMADVGSAQYITDWVRSRSWLKSRFGDSLVVIPLIPILCSGWDGRSTVRSLLEVTHWFMSLSDTEAVLMRGIMQKFVNTFLARSVGRGWADGRQCLRAPAGFDTKAFVSLVSEGWGCRPDAIPPVSPAAEQDIILSLIAMLNEAFDTNLCTAPLFHRKGRDLKAAVSVMAKELHIAVVGGSNAGRIASCLEREKRRVFSLTSPGWRITRSGVEGLVSTIGSLDPQPDCLIIQALDNSAFYCLQEDGTLSLPARSPQDGKYHVTGELQVASEEQTRALLKLLLPLLSAVPGATVFLVTCLPRYTMAPCCEDPTHTVGLGPGTAEKIISDLIQMKKHVRAFVAKEKLGQLRIVDPVQLLAGISMEGHKDPVHPPGELYEKLACRLMNQLEDRGRPAAAPERDQEPEPKRIRLTSYGTGRGGYRGGPASRGGRGGGRGAPRGGRDGRGRRGF